MRTVHRYTFKKSVINLINRILLCFFLIMFALIIQKVSPGTIKSFKNNLFNKSLNFIQINNLSKNLLGKELLYYQNNPDSSESVSATSIMHNEPHKYYEGEEFLVSNNLPIGAFESGVVVYTGQKEHYNNSVIIQNVDGFNVWYGNLKDINVKLYDYVEQNSLIGSADGDRVYVLIEKDNKYYTYDEYKKNKN